MSETIAALATPPGEGALAVIRVSGPASADIARAALHPPGSSPTLFDRRVQLAHYQGSDRVRIDQLVWIYYKAPRSFTGEDMLELIPHGSPFIVQRILEDLVARGCRLAHPGEFSRTAFLNGKIDLAQAEAIIDVIRARSDRALAIAHKQLSGALGAHVNGLVEELLTITAYLEAYIDFPDEDLPAENQAGPLRDLLHLQSGIERLMITERYRDRLQDGIRVVLIGEPNAGKSSLLNCLVDEDRAIVSEEAGTTRDFIEARVQIGGHLVRLYDTAGLRESDSRIERAGVEKTLEVASRADLLVFVHDCTVAEPEIPESVREILRDRPVLHLLNKADRLTEDMRARFDYTLAGGEGLWVSTATREGLPSLHDRMLQFLDRDFRVPEDADVAISARHASALQEAKACLLHAATLLQAGEPAELAATELHLALEAMARIVGRIDNERVLDELFGSFCIGK